VASNEHDETKEEAFANMPRSLFAIKLSRPASWQVLGALMSYADPDGANAYPSIDTIMADTGLTRRCVYYALSELRSVGLLSRRKRRHASSVYTITKHRNADRNGRNENA
jgi:hypothetical protein